MIKTVLLILMICTGNVCEVHETFIPNKFECEIAADHLLQRAHEEGTRVFTKCLDINTMRTIS